jgi:hypothetical protein
MRRLECLRHGISHLRCECPSLAGKYDRFTQTPVKQICELFENWMQKSWPHLDSFWVNLMFPFGCLKHWDFSSNHFHPLYFHGRIYSYLCYCRCTLHRSPLNYPICVIPSMSCEWQRNWRDSQISTWDHRSILYLKGVGLWWCDVDFLWLSCRVSSIGSMWGKHWGLKTLKVAQIDSIYLYYTMRRQCPRLWK